MQSENKSKKSSNNKSKSKMLNLNRMINNVSSWFTRRKRDSLAEYFGDDTDPEDDGYGVIQLVPLTNSKWRKSVSSISSEELASNFNTAEQKVFKYSAFERVGQLRKGEDAVLISHPTPTPAVEDESENEGTDGGSDVMNLYNKDAPANGEAIPTIFAIFDGHRSRMAAEFCCMNMPLLLHKHSKNFSKGIKPNEIVQIDVHSTAKNILKQTFVDCHELARDVIGRAGCTAVLAWFYTVHANPEKTFFVVANAGDSRAVLSKAGKAIRLSYDHKAIDAAEIRRVNDAGGTIIGGSLEGALAVTRGIGDFDFQPGFIPDPNLSDSIDCSDLTNEFVILASDGVWDMVDDQSAVDLVRNEIAKNGIQRASQVLGTHCARKGAFDDMSCIVVALQNYNPNIVFKEIPSEAEKQKSMTKSTTPEK